MTLKLPFTVACSVLACLEAEELERVKVEGELCAGLFDLSREEMDGLLTSKHFNKLRRHFLLQKVPLLTLFKDGLIGRVRAYNKLLKRNILLGQRRFSTAWTGNPSLYEEPVFSYPLDEPSVGYWQAVQAMQKQLLKHSLARLLRKRSRFHCHQASTFLFENCSKTIASTAYRLEHQFAKVLLKQNLSFPGEHDCDDSDSISLTSITSSVQTSNNSGSNSNCSSKVPSPPLSVVSNVKRMVHHNLFEEDSTSALYTPLPTQDFKWSLTGASWITETQTYYLIGDDGSFGLIQMGYSNITWPKTNCQVTALFYHPGDSKVTHKFESETVSSLRMKLYDGNMSVAAQSSSIALRASTPLSSGGSKDFGYTINYSMGAEDSSSSATSPFTIKLDYVPIAEPFKFGDGKVYLGANKADGFVEMKFVPAGRFDGVVQIDKELFPFSGQGVCFRQFLGVKPHNATKRWNCAYFLEKSKEGQPRRTLYMVQMQCSAQYNHEEVHYGFYFDGKQVSAVTSAGNSIAFGKTKTDPENGYSVPDHFEYTWQGVDRDGKAFEAALSGVPSSRVCRIDLMSSVPSMLRRVAESFTTARPFIYQYFDRDVEATINGETVRGDLFQEYSFLLEDPCQYTSP